MRILNEQGQLFVVAAACFVLGLLFLYAALGVYGLLVEKALNLFGLHGAILQYVLDRRNGKAWRRSHSWRARR